MTPLLYYLPRATKDFTDHAIIHSYNLLRILCELRPVLDLTKTLTEEERYVLCLSIFLHDLGCLIDRARHNEFSAKILDVEGFDRFEYEIGSDLWTCVKYVSISHSSTYEFSDLPLHPINPNVRLNLICALFRMVDGCDLTQTRANPMLYKILMRYDPLDIKSQTIWKAHFNIKGVVFEKHGRSVLILISSKRSATTNVLTDHLKDDLVKINQILGQYKFPEFKVDVRAVS